MADISTEVAFTEAVKAQQARLGSRGSYERWLITRGFAREITPELAPFIETRTSAYLGTASAQGRPYIQHRGGPEGLGGSAGVAGALLVVAASRVGSSGSSIADRASCPCRRRSSSSPSPALP